MLFVTLLYNVLHLYSLIGFLNFVCQGTKFTTNYVIIIFNSFKIAKLYGIHFQFKKMLFIVQRWLTNSICVAKYILKNHKSHKMSVRTLHKIINQSTISSDRMWRGDLSSKTIIHLYVRTFIYTFMRVI